MCCDSFGERFGFGRFSFALPAVPVSLLKRKGTNPKPLSLRGCLSSSQAFPKPSARAAENHLQTVCDSVDMHLLPG